MTMAPTTLPSSSRDCLRSRATSSSPPPRRRVSEAEARARLAWARLSRQRAPVLAGRLPSSPDPDARARRARAIADAERGQPRAGRGAGRQDVRPGVGRGEVALGPDVEAGAAGEDRRGGAGVRRSAGEEQVGAGGLVVAELLGPGGDRRRGGLDPGGVDQLDGQAVAFAAGREVVAGRAGTGRDQGVLAAEQGVEQPALARVGGAGEHDAGEPLGAVAAAEPVGQGGDLGGGVGQFVGELGAAERDRRRPRRRSRGWPPGGPGRRAGGRGAARSARPGRRPVARARRRAGRGRRRRSRPARPRPASGRACPRGRRGA